MVTNPILWEFGFGIIAFKLWDTRLLARLRRPLLEVAVLAAVAIVVVGASRGLPIFGASRTVVGEGSAARVLIWGLPAFGLVCLMLSMDKLSNGPVAGMLKSVGDASYSIYLSHLFVVMANAITAARAGDQPALNTAMADLDRALTRASTLQSGVGASLRTIDDDRARLSDAARASQTQIAALENVNMAEAISGMTEAETAYRAALGAAAKLQGLSLMDYLK